MISCKKILKYIVTLGICGVILNAFAIDQAAKEETSPPPEDGPLTIEQIPPIDNEPSPPAATLPASPVQSDQSANQTPPMQ
ncbi:MAG: hypothetical protein K0S27_965 [Gammaproteobacteria bacterium]|jgi:hypothetical protein|nr:hypothetical protein [Gammaproteobacteria bacterium]